MQPAERWVLAYLQLDEPAADTVQCDPLGSELVWHDGQPVGQISSGGYGYDQGHYLAFAYIKPALNQVDNEFEVLVMGVSRRAVIVEQCVYDPQNLLPRAEDGVCMLFALRAMFFNWVPAFAGMT